jgi:hypothetical protein
MDLYLFILLLGLGALLAHNRAPEAGPDSREAVVRAGVGQDLLQGLSRGRQGLVGSLRWAPLPTLLAAPLLRAPGVTGTTAMCLVAVAGSACLCVFLSRWWAQYGMRDAIRAPIVFALFLSPPMLRPVFEGTSETVFVFLVIATGAYLIHWWETEDLRSLAYTAVLAGMAALVRYQAVALTLAALAALCVHLVAERRREAYVEGTLITFLTPPLYFVGLWFAANWLIMGDACFFMRGLPGARAQGLLAMIGEACEWQACLLPGLIGVLGWGLCRLAGRKPTVWTGLPVLAACGLLWVEGTRPIQPAPPDPATVELRERVLPHLARHHRADRVVVSGYRGYEIHRRRRHVLPRVEPVHGPDARTHAG